LGFNKNGKIKVKLPQGPKYDSNRLYLHVRVIDNDNGAKIYYLTNAITVLPERQYVDILIESFLQDNPLSVFNQDLSIGSFQKSLQNILFISSYLNEESLENRLFYIQNSNHFLIKIKFKISFIKLIILFKILHCLLPFLDLKTAFYSDMALKK